MNPERPLPPELRRELYGEGLNNNDIANYVEAYFSNEPESSRLQKMARSFRLILEDSEPIFIDESIAEQALDTITEEIERISKWEKPDLRMVGLLQVAITLENLYPSKNN